MLVFSEVTYSYPNTSHPSINRVTLSIEKGEWVAVVGPNGSGKSTLAKLINGLLPPSEGEVRVGNRTTMNANHLRSIRRDVGMVFQNPENQMVATTVLDDVAFGLENIGFPSDQMLERIEWALEKVGMWGNRMREPHHLSGGEKQRLSIAGVLAMKPQLIVFDEVTSMLDPAGRNQVNQILSELHREGLTIISITHDLEEANRSERVLLMKEGQVVSDAPPQQIFTDIEWLNENDLGPPLAIEIRESLIQKGLSLPRSISTSAELVKQLWTLPSKT